MKVIILGAGLAGLSTAYHLKKDYEIFEKNDRAGGLCRSEKEKGFTFDYTGHLLHLKNSYTQKLIKKLLQNNLNLCKRNAWIYSKGAYTKYPFQANTYGSPKKVIKECLLGLIKAKYETKRRKVKTFEDFIYKTFGRGIARHFMIPYNQKVWQRHPRELTTEWLGRFVPQPNLEEFIDGALNIQSKNFGYNVTFWYPRKGGIESLISAFLSRVDNINLNKKAVKISLRKRTVSFQSGLEVKFDFLVSTIPLPVFISLIEDIPKKIKILSAKLRWVSVLNINFGVNRKLIDKHWIYFPEPDFIFYRVGFSSNFCPALAPPNSTAIYTEVSYGKKRPLPFGKREVEKRVIKDLIKARMLKSEDKISVVKTLDIPFAYVFYDKNWKNCTRLIHEYLRKKNIYSIGRYGGWTYSTMEDAILDGKEIAEKIRCPLR